MPDRTVDVLIIGAGPYGLALAAQVRRAGIDHLVIGEAMSFWRDHMPKGMFLRSATDWHLDPDNIHTMEAYRDTLGQSPDGIEPLSLDFYLGYAEWFQRQNGIAPIPERVTRLDLGPGNSFHVTCASGTNIFARRVVLALGFGAFPHVPTELECMLPAGSFGHTCQEIDLATYEGKRVLILGGRQSAYEWAALLHEAGASAVHIVHRHRSPRFAPSDWSWVGPLVDRMIADPGWFRRLPIEEQDEISRRLYEEGRLKLEPWLQARIEQDGIFIWPETTITNCMRNESGDLLVTLSETGTLTVDHIILATGYKVDIDRLPLLQAGSVRPHLTTRNGFPILDEGFQTSVPGLFMTSRPATQDFGPFFAFTIAARASAKVIANALRSPDARPT